MIRESHIRVGRTARYVLLGDPAEASELWVACHGYRQLARYFARPFQTLTERQAGPTDNSERARAVAVPEGLSRFYLDDDGGPHGPEARVGATWMTREDRDAEIDDYVAYLDTLAAHLIGSGDAPRVTAFGFSQGTATASRWAAYGEAEVDRLILWAGLPAHDLDFGRAGPKLAHVDIVLAFGSDDPHVPAGAVERAVEALHEAGVPARSWRYEGEHKVDASALTALTGFLSGAA